MTLYHKDKSTEIHNGDCLQVLRTLPDSSVDACVTDPPYGLAFMGKRWDYDVPSSEVWQEVLRVLKPGGHLLAFAGTRTQHRMAVRIEDAGFEIRDMIAWVYGSGFPKSLDVSKAIDKANGRKFDDRYALGRHIRERREAKRFTRAQVNEWLGAATKCEHYESESDGFARVPTEADYAILKNRLGLGDEFDVLVARVEAEREVVGRSDNGITGGTGKHAGQEAAYGFAGEYNITAPATEAANQWAGWGTALKPALEPITMARAPLSGTVAANVLEHGTGAINVDGCRIEGEYWGESGQQSGGKSKSCYGDGLQKSGRSGSHSAGRFPANLIHDGTEDVVGLFPEDGEASAARFFYCAKADAAERRNSKHPTIKPVALMRYLVRLVCPAGGLVLDPFAGSGTTIEAARLEHCRAIGIEREAEYCADILERLRQGVLF